MESPNSADINNTCTEAANTASIRSAADNKAKDTASISSAAGKEKDKVVKVKPPKKVGKASSSSKPSTDRFDSFEKLLKQMHRESREHEKTMSSRLDKLEQDYSQMNMYLNESGSQGQYDADEYPNQGGQYGPSTSMGTNYDDLILNANDDGLSDTADSASQSVSQDQESEIQNMLNKSEGEQTEPITCKTAGVAAPKSKGFSSKFANVEEVGPPVNETLATEVDFMLTERLQDSKIAEVLKTYHSPSNLKRLKSPKVNLPIWSTISEPIRKNDTRLQRVQTSLTCGLNAIIRSIGDEVASPELEDSMALLCNANFELNLSRKDLIRPELNPSYHHLCKKPTGVDYLFGDDLQQHVKDITEEKKAFVACAKVKSFGGFNRGQNKQGQFGQYRAHPYNPQQRRNRPFLGRGMPVYNQQQYQPYQQQQGRYNNFNRGRGRGKPPSTQTRPSQ